MCHGTEITDLGILSDANQIPSEIMLGFVKYQISIIPTIRVPTYLFYTYTSYKPLITF